MCSESFDEAEEVSGGKKKQDVLVSDSAGTMRLTLWENEIGKLDEGRSYKTRVFLEQKKIVAFRVLKT